MSERPPLFGAGLHIELDARLLSDPRTAEHIYALLLIRAEQDAADAEQDAGASSGQPSEAHIEQQAEQQAARLLREVRELREQHAAQTLSAALAALERAQATRAAEAAQSEERE